MNNYTRCFHPPDIVQVLAHPLRGEILKALSPSDNCVQELAEMVPLK